MRRGKQRQVTRSRTGTGTVVAGAVVLLLLAVTAGPLAAQTDPTAPPESVAEAEPAPFPVPIVAPMLSAPDPAVLAVRTVYMEWDEEGTNPTIVVRFAAPYTLPANGYRLSVLFGDPKGRSVRASMRAVEGAPVGSLEVGTVDAFAELGPIKATTTADGTARLTVPFDSLPVSGSVWVVAELTDPAASFVSPLYPLDQFLDRGVPGVLSASSSAWMTRPGEVQPTLVDLQAPPELTVEGTTVSLRYSEPVPTEVGGVLVSTLVDVVRIAPDYDDAGQAPFLVAVDHVSGTVNLLDGTQPIPATLTPASDEWLLTELPSRISDGTVVEFDLELVAEEFGIEFSPDTMALGAARSITLSDDTVVRADGVQATLAWFEFDAPIEPVAPETAAPAERGGSPEDGLPWVLMIGGAAVVLLLAIAGLRWRRRSRDADATENLLDSAGPLSLGRRLPAPDGDGTPMPSVDLRKAALATTDSARAGTGLSTLFTPDPELDGDKPIEVPDLALFDESAADPADRPARLPARKRPGTEEDLTRALFDGD
jgi:hypothetical protein